MDVKQCVRYKNPFTVTSLLLKLSHIDIPLKINLECERTDDGRLVMSKAHMAFTKVN